MAMSVHDRLEADNTTTNRFVLLWAVDISQLIAEEQAIASH
jgi:hypothetical protein